MSKTILITGATDGIGLLTAKTLAGEGHRVLLHGRSAEKLEAAAAAIPAETKRYRADFSKLAEVASMADAIRESHPRIDVLINNAGVFKTRDPRTPEGLDVRIVVNTFAPYLLAQRLLPVIPKDGRIVNLSSAAQEPVDPTVMAGRKEASAFSAYAQSKLALTLWTREMAAALPEGPVVVAVNPGSLLASKMVTEGFGVSGNDLSIGVEILRRAALDPSFAGASGQYFDNDAGRFGPPHAAVSDPAQVGAVMQALAERTSAV